MGSWLDRWARGTAARGPAPVDDAHRPSPEQPSRRSFLKKAAVVTGTAWSVPVLQTALAPMASASPGVVVGSPCTPPTVDGTPCGDGSFCFAGICGANGAICTDPAQCVSGACAGGVCVALGAPGALCSGDASCQYANCSPNGVCGGLDATCAEGNVSCVSGLNCTGPNNPKTCK